MKFKKEDLHPDGRPFTQEEFINKIKNDDEFAKTWGELGPIYGKQWRNWGSNFIDDLDDVYTNEVNYDIQNGRLPDGSSNRKFVIDEIKKHNPRIDQIENLINDLKTNPDSRRLMVSAWNVGELDQCVLPPCHYSWQVYTRELNLDERCTLANFAPFDDRFPDGDGFKWDEHTINIAEDWLRQHHPNLPTRAISLMWNQRSVDTFLGLPFNIASYGLLLEIIAKEVNMVPDELIGNLGDVHLYSNHIEQAKEQIGRDYTLEERLNMVSEEIQKEFSSGIVNLPNFPNTPVWSDDGKMSCLDDFGVPRRTREPFPLPKLIINTEFWPTESGECGIGPLSNNVDHVINNMKIEDFEIENYQSHPSIKAPLSN